VKIKRRFRSFRNTPEKLNIISRRCLKKKFLTVKLKKIYKVKLKKVLKIKIKKKPVLKYKKVSIVKYKFLNKLRNRPISDHSKYFCRYTYFLCL